MSNSLNVSMIVIGDEILNGRTTDLNGSWLSKFLFRKGLNLKSLRFIRDDSKEIDQALKLSLNESDIVITSGGIGPTIDDKTKKALASFFGKQIIQRDDVAKIVTQNYIQFGRSWTPDHNHYHFFPEDFIATNNPRGLAPGLVYFDQSTTKLILAGPGVPREFTEIVECEFFPLIKKFFNRQIKENYQTVIRTKGVPEEMIFFELCPTLWQDLEAFGKVSSLPHTIGIDIVVSYNGSKSIHLDNQQKIKSLIEKSPLAQYVWQYGNNSLNELVLARSLLLNKTFAIAESCTGGLTSSKITDLSGSSQFFMGGVITYSNQAKIDLLGVNPQSLEDHGAVSAEVATQMAEGVRHKFKTDYAISITGIAGPTGETKDKPLGLVYIGFANEFQSGAKMFQMPGDRIRRKERFSDTALLILLEMMNEQLNQ